MNSLQVQCYRAGLVSRKRLAATTRGVGRLQGARRALHCEVSWVPHTHLPLHQNHHTTCRHNTHTHSATGRLTDAISKPWRLQTQPQPQAVSSSHCFRLEIAGLSDEHGGGRGAGGAYCPAVSLPQVQPHESSSGNAALPCQHSHTLLTTSAHLAHAPVLQHCLTLATSQVLPFLSLNTPWHLTLPFRHL